MYTSDGYSKCGPTLGDRKCTIRYFNLSLLSTRVCHGCHRGVTAITMAGLAGKVEGESFHSLG